MINYLVTGANGFIANSFIRYLEKNKDIKLFCLTRKKNNLTSSYNKEILEYDPSDEVCISEILKKTSPNYIFHFAAQSSPVLSWEEPEYTISSNFKTVLFILNGLNKYHIKSELINISSSSIYKESSKGIKETSVLELNSPYSLSKYCQEIISEIYSAKYNINLKIIRPFFVTGPGKENDVISDWAKGIVNIENKLTDTLRVGNVNGVERDFLHIKDFISALLCVTKQKTIGTFNICSGKPIKLEDLLKLFISKSKSKINVEIGKEKFRRINDSIVYGDNSKIKKMGWLMKYNINNIIDDQLNFYRNNKI